MTPNIVLFDIDNTLANCDARLHYLERAEIDWDEFEDQAVYDLPIPQTIVTAQAFNVAGKQVWCWTGRRERIRALTEAWLKKHGVPFAQLLMKPTDSQSPAELWKLRWLNESPIPKDRVICAYDDDPRVVKVLREQGKILVNKVVRPE